MLALDLVEQLRGLLVLAAIESTSRATKLVSAFFLPPVAHPASGTSKKATSARASGRV